MYIRMPILQTIVHDCYLHLLSVQGIFPCREYIDVHAQLFLDLTGIVQMPLFWEQGIFGQAGKALSSCLLFQPEHIGQFFGRS